MEKHVKNYLDGLGYDVSDFIPCEVCGAKSVDIHHVDRRSSFGSRNAEQKDALGNLVGLCRQCHNDAHGPNAREIKIKLKEIVLNRLNRTKV